MTATGPIRTTVKRALHGLLVAEANLAGIVVYGAPRQPPRDCVWIGEATGEQRVPNMRAGRKDREDRFRVAVYCYSRRPGHDASEAEERAEELAAVVDDVLAENVTLGGLAGLIHAVVGEVTGPDSEPYQDEGFHAWSALQVTCLARLH